MEQKTSCINSKVVLDYVKKHNHGDCSELLQNLDPEIDILPGPERFLSDPNNWISCTVISKLYEKATQRIDDRFGVTAVKNGFISREQLFEALKISLLKI